MRCEGGCCSSSGEKGKASGGGGRMKAWQGVLHAASVFAAVWLCRYTLFDAILWGTGHRPSGGLLVGALLLVASAACVPIVALHFSHVQAARRAMTLGIVAGILFVLLQPPLLPAWNAFWDADHMPDTTDADDAKIYGASLHGPAWPSWLLLAAVMGTVAALSSAIPIVQKAGGETAWLPAIGNAATLLCFALALLLNATVTGGSDRSIFFIVPVLLLLNQDASTLAGFTDRQRYFPLTVAISGYLACAALYRLYEEIHLGLQVSGWQVPTGGASTMFVAKNLALLLLTLPNHAFFNRFMWDYAKQSDYVLLLITPLNLPATVLADIMAVRALSFLGIAYAIGQYLVSRHVRLAGNKFI
eukprot:jgi/Mesen1/5804/ME000293S04962